MGLLRRIVLVIAGLILLVVGGALLIFPLGFLESNGVVIGSDPSLMSEIRAPGGLLLTTAIVMFIGAAVESVTRPALILASMVYVSYGMSRVISMTVDGLPSSQLISAAVFELLIGAICIVALLIRKKVEEE